MVFFFFKPEAQRPHMVQEGGLEARSARAHGVFNTAKSLR